MSSVWNEPISFVITNLRPYTTYLFEVSAVTTEAGYIDSAIVRTPESGIYCFQWKYSSQIYMKISEYQFVVVLQDTSVRICLYLYHTFVFT